MSSLKKRGTANYLSLFSSERARVISGFRYKWYREMPLNRTFKPHHCVLPLRPEDNLAGLAGVEPVTLIPGILDLIKLKHDANTNTTFLMYYFLSFDFFSFGFEAVLNITKIRHHLVKNF